MKTIHILSILALSATMAIAKPNPKKEKREKEKREARQPENNKERIASKKEYKHAKKISRENDKRYRFEAREKKRFHDM